MTSRRVVSDWNGNFTRPVAFQTSIFILHQLALRHDIAPSLLAANPVHFGKDAVRADHSGADWLHLDIMDAISCRIFLRPGVVKAIRPSRKCF